MTTLGPHAIGTLILTAIAFYMFSRTRPPVQTSSVLIIAVLAIGFSAFPYRGAKGEARPARPSFSASATRHWSRSAR